MDTSDPVNYPEFTPFTSIARYDREAVITEKIDGTNGQIFIEDPALILDGRLPRVFAGSRNRWLGTEKNEDAFGFGRWVKEHEDELRLVLGPGRHFGEWWGGGIQRGYGLGHEKRFSLFNVGRWTAETKPACCHVVPVIWRGAFQEAPVEDALERLDRHGSFAAPGFMEPEGVVVFHVPANVAFKKTLGGDGHKSERRK
jgi:hypothetical protein